MARRAGFWQNRAMTSAHPTTVIVGVGPGLGAALAARFAREGHAIALLSRSSEHREPILASIRGAGGRAEGFDCDAASAESVARAFAEVRRALGDPEVLVYNAGAFVMAGALELTPDAFEAAWRVNCQGGFLASREVLPAMLERGRGTILFTGATASVRGGARFSALAVGKFGLRALAQSLAREFGARGVHVVHVVVDGMIDGERIRARLPERGADTFLDPAALAETYWQLHAQPRSAWTLELDVRPNVERF